MHIIPIFMLAATSTAAPRQQLDVMKYDAFMTSAFGAVHWRLASVLATDLSAQDRVLEIALGAPYSSIKICRVSEARIDAVVEGSMEAQLSVRRLDEAGLPGSIQLHTARVDLLPFPDSTFDVVLARDVMRFWHAEPRAFAEINRVLKRGGEALLGSDLQRIMSPAQADSFWIHVKEWRQATDCRPWSATIPSPEANEAALDSAGVTGYRLLSEGACLCRTSVRWRKGVSVLRMNPRSSTTGKHLCDRALIETRAVRPHPAMRRGASGSTGAFRLPSTTTGR